MTEIDASAQPPARPYASIQFALILVFLLLLVLLLYTSFHEFGHAWVGMLFGGRVTTFSANFFNMTAHVGLDGDFTAAQSAAISAAGVSLPVFLCMALVLGTPKETEPILEWFRLLVFMGSVNALLAWVIIPILVSNGQTISDDSASFLGYTHFHPLAVSGAALLVYLAGWAIYLSRAGGLRGLVSRLRGTSVDLSLAQSRKTLRILVATGVVIAAITFGLTQALPDTFLKAPNGYTLAAQVDLSTRSLTGEGVTSLNLEEASSVTFFFALQNVKGQPVRIELAGQDGYENVFLANTDPGFNAVKATIHPQALALGPGFYEVRITAPQGPGRITVYARVE